MTDPDDPNGDELDPNEQGEREKRKYGVFSKEKKTYSDDMEVEDNENSCITYASFEAMKLDSEMVEPACSYLW